MACKRPGVQIPSAPPATFLPSLPRSGPSVSSLSADHEAHSSWHSARCPDRLLPPALRRGLAGRDPLSGCHRGSLLIAPAVGGGPVAWAAPTVTRARSKHRSEVVPAYRRRTRRSGHPRRSQAPFAASGRGARAGPGGSKALTSGNTVSPSCADFGGAYNEWRTLPLSTVWVHGRARPHPAGLGAVAVLAAVMPTATVCGATTRLRRGAAACQQVEGWTVCWSTVSCAGRACIGTVTPDEGWPVA
jgi:hypothetical protein